MIGAQTIGNATVIAYDKKPILATDPWLGLDHYAYFGSWYLPYSDGLVVSFSRADICNVSDNLRNIISLGYSFKLGL